MGAKHSKPRIRRSRRFSSLRKRQAPEGSNDPVPSPSEAASCKSNNKSGLDEGCQYCGSAEGCINSPREIHATKVVGNVVTKERMPQNEQKLFREDFIEDVGLKVDVPPPYSPVCCRSCVATEKSKSLPLQYSLQNCNKMTDKETEEEQDWTITLYEIDKISGRVPREDMVRLMSSIFDAVDAKVADSPQGRKTVRVRLSVTPERRREANLLQRTASASRKERADDRCSDCPHTEPTTRRASSDTKSRRHHSEASPARPPPKSSAAAKTARSSQRRPVRDLPSENSERRKHYARLEGLDDNMHLHRREQDGSVAAKQAERENPPPLARQPRTWPKFDDGRPQPQKTPGGPKQHRQRCQSGEKRAGRRKDPRFASPYDPHFQEAMYLRLRELQRQGASVLRNVNGPRDSDEADDDSDSGLDETKPGDRPIDRNCCSGVNSNDELGTKVDAVVANCFEQSRDFTDGASRDDPDSSAVHLHHHYHHGVSVARELSSPDALASKCVADAANSSCSSSALPKACDSDCKSEERHYHHYHHHYHHVAGS